MSFTPDPLLNGSSRSNTPRYLRTHWDERTAREFGPWRIAERQEPAAPQMEPALALPVAEAELMRDRWYWYDRKVSQVSRYYRLAYQPLTRQWRLQVSSEPVYAAGAASSIAQSFDSLQAALDVVRRQSGWKLADAADLEADTRQHVLYRFRLDMSQLPRPFQIAAGNQADWNLSLNRQLRIAPEAGP